MANKVYIERLQGVIKHLHKCDSTWVESVPVKEVFKGQTIWVGIVEVLDLTGDTLWKQASLDKSYKEGKGDTENDSRDGAW